MFFTISVTARDDDKSILRGTVHPSLVLYSRRMVCARDNSIEEGAMQTSNCSTGLKTLIGVCAFWCMTVGVVSAQGTWVEEVGNVVAYYQLISPSVEWTPYIDALTRARDGLRRGDQLVVTAAMDEFESMLRGKAYGIDGAMAEELYNLALTVRSPYEQDLGSSISSEMERSRLMISPVLKINMQPQDRVWCHEGGCDEWISDPNAG